MAGGRFVKRNGTLPVANLPISRMLAQSAERLQEEAVAVPRKYQGVSTVTLPLFL